MITGDNIKTKLLSHRNNYFHFISNLQNAIFVAFCRKVSILSKNKWSIICEETI